MPADPTPNLPPAGQVFSRQSLGRGLLFAFVVLALLPAFTGLPAWYGSRSIQEPLQQVANAIDAFGRHDRGFREHVRSLYAGLFVSRNFQDRETFETTSATLLEHLAGMRGHVEALARNNLVPTAADYLGAQQRVEDHTHSYLDLVDRRLAARDRVRAIAAEMTNAAADVAVLAGNPDGVPPATGATLSRSAQMLADLARTADDADGDSQQAEAEAALAAARDALAGMPAGSPRAALRVVFDRLNSLAFADDGLYASRQGLRELDAREFDDRLALRADVIGIIGRLVEVDEANDVAASNLLRTSGETLRNYSTSLIVTIVVGTALALAVVLLFVRGNVLRRLQALTSTTRRLTNGQLDEPVAGEGRDELTELAAALETFRLSALELRESRAQLKRHSEELELVNRELDQFAYVASHDLKAPLRAIGSLAGFLREDMEAVLTAEARGHLDMLEGRVARLGGLLDSLLEYSRAGRVHAPQENIDLRELIEHSVDLVAPAGSQVRYTGDFGRVTTRRAPLEQIVRNLVDNAFKHNDEAEGLVSVDCDIVDNAVRLVIEDSGPGIEPRDHDRVFGMFQTLKPRDHVEGSGMGLAILKKLVDSYGGSISLDSDPAIRRGTTFTVHWPVDAVLHAPGRRDDPRLRVVGGKR